MFNFRGFCGVCALKIPNGMADRSELEARLLAILDRICENSLWFARAKTLRKRLLPGAREHREVFSFELFGEPPTTTTRIVLCDRL